MLAGYKQPDGSVMGDPSEAEFTSMLEKEYGWRGPEVRSRFDFLPMVLQVSDGLHACKIHVSPCLQVCFARPACTIGLPSYSASGERRLRGMKCRNARRLP